MRGWEHQSVKGRLRKSAYEGSQEEIKVVVEENHESAGLETSGLEFQDQILSSGMCYREDS